jgi:hypothetical protein
MTSKMEFMLAESPGMGTPEQAILRPDSASFSTLSAVLDLCGVSEVGLEVRGPNDSCELLLLSFG